MRNLFDRYKRDLSAGLVVFFVALPLCLGIALASGAPLFSGVIAGVIGGIVVGIVSKSPLGVSGPAAGLAVIVFNAIEQLGSWEVFLLAVFLAGVIQLAMGFARLGIIGYYFPSSVIKGMLTGIGLLIIIKQVPHALGYKAAEDGLAGVGAAGSDIMTWMSGLAGSFTGGAVLISAISLAILILWDVYVGKKHRIFQVLQGPLVVVFAGIAITHLFRSGVLAFSLDADQMVNLPVTSGLRDFFGQFTRPDFSALTNVKVYTIAVTMAIVASLETLLCVEATDKLDPQKRLTPANRELKAQGLGNLLSGLLGGLPVTQVIVRSSANISFGGKTKVSTIFHGVLLLICAFAIPFVLNMIPLAALACILILVGYKLAKPAIFKEAWTLGPSQFVPFLATVIGVVATDLLTGIGIGIAFAIAFLLYNNYRNSFEFVDMQTADKSDFTFVLSEEMSFLSKARLVDKLSEVPDGANVTIDGTRSKFIDFDIFEIIENFRASAAGRNIALSVTGLDQAKIA